MIETAVKSILNFGNFSKDELALFRDKLQLSKYEKNEPLVLEGDICQRFYFTLTGSCRHYQVNSDNEQIILNLYPKHTWFTEFSSFTTQKPSRSIISAFEDCEVAMLNIHDMHELILRHPPFFRLGRIIDYLKYPDHSSHSPLKAYERLLAERPQLILTFPLKDIASLLRITPETLSRVRAKTAMQI